MMHPTDDHLPRCAAPPPAEAARLLDPAMAAGQPGTATDPATSPESLHFLEAWNRWRGGKLLPHRRDVDLVSICKLMPQFVVLEVSGPDRAMFRLAGTEVEQQFGSRLTGRNFVKLADPADQPRRGQRLWQIVNQPCAALMRLVVDRQSGLHSEVEIAMAPVLPDDAAAAPQLFVVVSRLPKWKWGSSTDPVAHTIGRNLRFLDIGCGIPAAG